MQWKPLGHGSVALRLMAWGLFVVIELTVGQVRAAETSLIRDAFEKTKTAKTIEDFSQIITLCEQAQQSGLSEQMAGYAPKLMSWARNRRGEIYSAQAAESLVAGSVQRAAELDELARTDFESAVQLDPNAWKPWHNRGVSRGLRGDREAALRDFSRVIELKPGYLDAWFNRAEIRADMGQDEAAIQDYTRVIELRPTDVDAYLKRAFTYAKRGDLTQALTDCNAAVALDKDDVRAYANRGWVYERLSRWEDAAADFRAAVSADSESVLAYRSAAWLMATCPDPKFRDDSLAVQAAERALQLSREPHDWRTLDILAAAYASAGQFQQAVEYGTQAVAGASGPMRAAAEQRLELYRQRKSYRQPSVTTAAAGAGRVSR